MLEDVLKDWGAYEVDAMEVYSDIFHLGEGYIQKRDAEVGNMKANPLGYWKNYDSNKGHYRVFFEDTFEDTLKELQEADFCIMNGISYFGRRNTQEKASKMYAMIFDLDGVTETKLNNFLSGSIKAEAYPVPNYIALSGHGVHLYYVMDEPISLYPNIKLQLKAFKYALTDRMWNDFTSELKDRQYQGINQGFRCIGGKTKIEGVRVRAFRLNTHPFTLGQLGEYILDEYKVDEEKIWKESRMTLAEAKKMYPEWYKSRIEDGDKTKGHWTCKRDLYDWWKRQIEKGASLHHRYFNIMCLAIYGIKSGISEEEVIADAEALIPFMNDIAPEEPFTKEDMLSALECYDSGYFTFPIDDIEKISGIDIPRNKRNYQKQAWHLEDIRAKKERMKKRGQSFKAPEGRPSKREAVELWRAHNMDKTKADCIRELGLSKPTVYKYWK